MINRIFWLMMPIIAVLAGCTNDEVILDGERLDLRADLTGTGTAAPEATPVNRAVPIRLPGQVTNANWTHPGGTAAHTTRHPRLASTLQEVWAVDIGTGNTRGARLTATPVVQGERVFALDALGRVTALGTNGDILWKRDLTPQGENPGDASGGGLAVSGRQLFVTTGFGQLHALNAATGATDWIQKLDAAVTSAPTVSGNTVIVVTRNDRAVGLNISNGRIRWEVPGVGSGSGLVGGASAAVADSRVVLPFSSGQIVAVTLNDGASIWATTLTGQRNTSSFARILDVAGDPVIDAGTVYVANSSGRMMASNVGTGERLWTIAEGAQGPVAVAGGSVFFISDTSEFMRVDAQTGERIWGIELPFREPVRRLNRIGDTYVHYGPVLAGGRFLIASDDGILREFNPVDGRLIRATTLPFAAARPPVIAGGTLYLVTEDGTLRAFR